MSPLIITTCFDCRVSIGANWSYYHDHKRNADLCARCGKTRQEVLSGVALIDALGRKNNDARH
jgi:hypothetical protein